jgi:hypothetical protein
LKSIVFFAANGFSHLHRTIQVRKRVREDLG